MSAEAEATDILVRISLQGTEYFLRFAGKAAERGLALLFAALKALYEKTKGRQKLGGKFNPRTFLESFVASSVFSLSKDDMQKLIPELKRLHIPYMQYKTTKDMKSDGKVEISVRQEDAERFIRLAESKGIAALSAYDFKCEEISENTYEDLLNDGAARGVDFFVSPDGTVQINERKNPTPAPTTESPSLPSEQGSERSSDGNIFDPQKGIDKNLAAAKVEAMRRDGRLVPISANKETLLIEHAKDGVILTVPGTKQSERMFVPQGDITNMEADGGLTIRADLRADQTYHILDTQNRPLREMSGREIKESGNWNRVSEQRYQATKPRAPRTSAPQVKTPQPRAKGGR